MKQIFFFFFIILAWQVFAQTQPTQPITGYAGLASTYSSVTTFNCDDGATGFMLYIPTGPFADSLPVVVFTHGFGEWNPLRYGRWIDHIVKRGNIVIFPRYQLSEYTTLSSSFTPNAVTGIKRAIDTILMHPTWTQPELDKVFYIGHSYGGLISANLSTKYAAYNIPKPKALLMACPGYGQYPGGQLSSYSTMDSSIFVLDIFEHDDNVVDSTFALQVFNQTTAVPYSHKNLVIHFADSTGTPPITSTHGESSCIDSTYTNGDNGLVMTQAAYAYTDATDFYCYWKLFDALEDCALTGTGCTTAFGDTYPQKYMGLWSNGTPVRPLEVRPANITVINNIVSEGNVNLYPNPTTGKFIIESASIQKQTFQIVDLNGRLILSQQINGTGNIDATNLSEGIYTLTIKAADNVVNKKLVIMR